MPNAKTYWVCEFCARKKFAHKGRTAKHEIHCFSNPNRIPFLGELTFIWQTGTIIDYGYDEYINGDWLEWNDHPEMPAWWPGESGMIWDGEAWQKVPGYEITAATGAHGCAGGAPPEDKWPIVLQGRLDEWPAADRLNVLAAHQAGETIG